MSASGPQVSAIVAGVTSPRADAYLQGHSVSASSYSHEAFLVSAESVLASPVHEDDSCDGLDFDSLMLGYDPNPPPFESDEGPALDIPTFVHGTADEDAEVDDDADTEPPDLSLAPHTPPVPPQADSGKREAPPAGPASIVRYQSVAHPDAVVYGTEYGVFSVKVSELMHGKIDYRNDVFMPLADNMEEARRRGRHISLVVGSSYFDEDLFKSFSSIVLEPLCRARSRFMLRSLSLVHTSIPDRSFARLCKLMSQAPIREVSIIGETPLMADIELRNIDGADRRSRREIFDKVARHLKGLLDTCTSLQKLTIAGAIFDPAVGIDIINHATKRAPHLESIRVWRDAEEFEVAAGRAEEAHFTIDDFTAAMQRFQASRSSVASAVLSSRGRPMRRARLFARGRG